MSDEVIDLTFVLSDLVDINLTDAEVYETSIYDAQATATVEEHEVDSNTPLGKQVI